MKMRAWARMGRFVGKRRRRSVPARSERNVSVSSRPSAVEKRPSAGAAKTTESAGYVAYGDFVKDELDAQDKRKSSFEQRGLAVITTSGALVTLLFALAA